MAKAINDNVNNVRTLAPRLKNRLVLEMFHLQYSKMFYFFNDYVYSNFSEKKFIRKVLSGLES
jgi:hypothetical protein